MFIEIHLLQSFAPSNLNRDDTGAPKDCEFGGYRRARISSQCLKRAIRTEFKDGDLVDRQRVADRSKRLRNEVASYLAKHYARDLEQAQQVVSVAFGGLGILFEDIDDGENKSEYLIFAGQKELQRFADVCQEEWPAFEQKYRTVWEKKAGKKPGKTDAIKAVSAQRRKMLAAAFDGGKAVDLALFGRMLADLPERNVDAASQVAHAISTNKVSVEFDFYTALDDLKPDDTAGADMMGTIEFNAACFYRYANLDLDQLGENLGGPDDPESASLTSQSVEAFLRASITAVPTGKQNSMAAQNPPSLVFVVLRERGLWSLANAFLKPIGPSPESDLVAQSAQALDTYWAQLEGMYGESGIRGKWIAALDASPLENLASSRISSVDQLIENVLTTAFPAAVEPEIAS